MTNGATEIFVDYGEEWFAWRERNGAFSGMIPFERHFIRADAMIKRFVEENEYLIVANIPKSERDQQRLENLLSKEENQVFSKMNGDDLKAFLETKYKLLLDKATEEDPKIAYVLPPVDQIHNLIKIGLSTARYSVPNSLQSTTWLDTHGFCMDNMRMGRSTIPQAGMGAFAVRSMPEGSIVATTPVVTLYRDLLKTAEKSKQDTNDVQLLMNYCFGHPNTTLLMFPYSSTVHFINHGDQNVDNQDGKGGTTANSKIRWSHSEYQASELLEKSLEEMKELQKTGLMIDIVATR